MPCCHDLPFTRIDILTIDVTGLWDQDLPKQKTLNVVLGINPLANLIGPVF